MKKYNEKTVDVGGATGMSGADKAKLSNIARDVEQIKAVSITYAELKALRDAGNLVPGRQYRITDYHCTTTQADTMSADHQFDIIVAADTNSVLNENARACLHEGDTYFSSNGCKLESWQLKYCIDNDDIRFAWADDENGKGVIFFMKDEWNNECPYDFKNIMFKRWYDEDKECHVHEEIEDVEPHYCHTFCMWDFFTDSSHDVTVEQRKYISDEGVYYYNYGNIIKPYINSYSNEEEDAEIRERQDLNNICFVSDTNYCYCNDDYSYCEYYGVYDNAFGNNCYDSDFGNNSYDNTFGNGCFSNTFGNACIGNTFGDDCYENTFGDFCYSNTFGYEFYQNTYGDSFFRNIFGYSCYYNTLGNNCYDNIFGNNCHDNIFGDDCHDNIFGNNCYYNIFGNNCYYNIFGNNCSYNTFGNSSSVKNYVQNIALENGVSYTYINCTATTSNSSYFQNVHVNSGVCGTFSNRKNLTVSTAGNNFITTFGSSNDTKINV